MRIRSVTVFAPPEELRAAGALAQRAAARLREAGYIVQTVRGALPPVAGWLEAFEPGGASAATLSRAARRLDAEAAESAIDYLSLGPLSTARAPGAALLEALADIFAATERLFASAEISTAKHGVLGTALPAVARTMLAISRQPPSGFNNVRFAALAHCAPGIPFFPAAYAEQSGLSFALAMEAADLAIEACRAEPGYAAAAGRLSASIAGHAGRIEPLMDAVAAESRAAFLGCDWSLAPHPDEGCSTAAAIEALSGAPLGSAGTLSAIAALTRAIRSAPARHAGFGGVFLPVLEDGVLARRVIEGRIGLQHLLLYSSVCGTGLDTIPLPGDVRPEALCAVLGDVGALGAALRKPLTVRLLPIPGARAGDATRFDFPFFVNSAVMALDTPAHGPVQDEFLPVGRY